MATTSSIIGIVVTVVAVHLWAMVLVQQAHSFTLDGIPARCHNPLRIHQEQYQHRRRQRSSFIAAASSSSSSITLSSINSTKQAVEKLKKVLEREYVSFFDPMERSWYATDVSFEDPMTSLSGVDAYQGNVDMVRPPMIYVTLLCCNRNSDVERVTMFCLVNTNKPLTPLAYARIITYITVGIEGFSTRQYTL